MVLELLEQRTGALVPQHLHHRDQRPVAGGLGDAQVEHAIRVERRLLAFDFRVHCVERLLDRRELACRLPTSPPAPRIRSRSRSARAAARTVPPRTPPPRSAAPRPAAQARRCPTRCAPRRAPPPPARSAPRAPTAATPPTPARDRAPAAGARPARTRPHVSAPGSAPRSGGTGAGARCSGTAWMRAGFARSRRLGRNGGNAAQPAASTRARRLIRCAKLVKW